MDAQTALFETIPEPEPGPIEEKPTYVLMLEKAQAERQAAFPAMREAILAVITSEWMLFGDLMAAVDFPEYGFIHFRDAVYRMAWTDGEDCELEKQKHYYAPGGFTLVKPEPEHYHGYMEAFRLKGESANEPAPGSDPQMV